MPARLLALTLAVALLAACGEPEYPPDPGVERQEPAVTSPSPVPSAADLAYVQEALIDDTAVAEQPGEIIRLEPERVVGFSVTREGQMYDVERTPEAQLTQDGRPGPASAGAIQQLLARYTPLEAQAVLPNVDAGVVTQQPTHRVLFHFDDESTRDVAFLQHGDFAAVVSQPEGPVYRISAAQLAELVPPPAAMR
jgi:hypothetical protein